MLLDDGGNEAFEMLLHAYTAWSSRKVNEARQRHLTPRGRPPLQQQRDMVEQQLHLGSTLLFSDYHYD